jgi:aryl-alcohol dehydrogenase-like predicted oxidoreductase
MEVATISGVAGIHQLFVDKDHYELSQIRPHRLKSIGTLSWRHAMGLDGRRAGSLRRYGCLCYDRDEMWRILEAVREIAREIDSTPSIVSLAWLLAQPVITAPIVGANSVEQLGHNLAADEVTLTPEQLLRLDKVSSWQNA